MKDINFSIVIFSLLVKNVFMIKDACYPQVSQLNDVKCTNETIDNNSGLKKICCTNDAWVDVVLSKDADSPKHKLSPKNIREIQRSLKAYLAQFTVKKEEKADWQKVAKCLKNNIRVTYDIHGSKTMSFYLLPFAHAIIEKQKDDQKIQKISKYDRIEGERKITVTETKYEERCFIVSDNTDHVANPKSFKDQLIISGLDVSLDQYYQNVYKDLKREVMYKLNNGEKNFD